MVLFRSGEPHAVIRCVAAPVAQDQRNLIRDVHCKTPEHRIRSRRQIRQRLQNKLMRHNFAFLYPDERIVLHNL